MSATSQAATIPTAISFQEFADMLGVSRSTARRIVLEYKYVDYIRVGDRYSVPFEAAKAFAEHHTHKAERMFR